MEVPRRSRLQRFTKFVDPWESWILESPNANLAGATPSTQGSIPVNGNYGWKPLKVKYSKRTFSTLEKIVKDVPLDPTSRRFPKNLLHTRPDDDPKPEVTY